MEEEGSREELEEREKDQNRQHVELELKLEKKEETTKIDNRWNSSLNSRREIRIKIGGARGEKKKRPK
jgi:hypothetical protein